MKTIKFFTILITPLIAGIACCMIILKVCNINVNSVTNLLLSKIPGINQFVELLQTQVFMPFRKWIKKN